MMILATGLGWTWLWGRCFFDDWDGNDRVTKVGVVALFSFGVIWSAAALLALG